MSEALTSKQLVDELPDDMRDDLPTSRADAEREIDEFATSFAGAPDKGPSSQNEPFLSTCTTEPNTPLTGKVFEYVVGGTATRVIHNVPYRTLEAKDAWKHALDVYLPSNTDRAPIMIHIHGGGWQRGDRSNNFYGAPGMSNGYASMGFVTVAPSYRLGNFDEIIDDVTAAIAFTINHIREIDPALSTVDVSRIYLSGHSAGGHIVATLLTNSAYLDLVKVDSRLIKGAFLVSGIYALRNPFGEKFTYWKNNIFRKRYVEKTFRPEIIDSASPAWRIAHAHLSQAELENFTKRTTKPVTTCRWFGKAAEAEVEAVSRMANVYPSMRILEIPTIIFSASYDLGLENDAQAFYEMLVRCGARTERAVIADTWHPTICQSPATFATAAEYLRSWGHALRE